jgi:hypothetical protein
VLLLRLLLLSGALLLGLWLLRGASRGLLLFRLLL